MAKPWVFSKAPRDRALARFRRAGEMVATGRCLDARDAFDDASRLVSGLRAAGGKPLGQRLRRAQQKAQRKVATCGLGTPRKRRI